MTDADRLAALLAEVTCAINIERAMGDPVTEEMAQQTRDRHTRRNGAL